MHKFLVVTQFHQKNMYDKKKLGYSEQELDYKELANKNGISHKRPQQCR